MLIYFLAHLWLYNAEIRHSDWRFKVTFNQSEDIISTSTTELRFKVAFNQSEDIISTSTTELRLVTIFFKNKFDWNGNSLKYLPGSKAPWWHPRFPVQYEVILVLVPRSVLQAWAIENDGDHPETSYDDQYHETIFGRTETPSYYYGNIK